MGLVDVLHGLDLIAGRARAAGADFILSGPLNMWFRGISPPPRTPLYILVTSTASSGTLVDAVSIGARRLDWPPSWSRVGGRTFNGDLRGLRVAVLTDPWMEVDGVRKTFKAAEMARISSHVLIGNDIVRLAPLEFEYTLRSVVGAGYGELEG